MYIKNKIFPFTAEMNPKDQKYMYLNVSDYVIIQ